MTYHNSHIDHLILYGLKNVLVKQCMQTKGYTKTAKGTVIYAVRANYHRAVE